MEPSPLDYRYSRWDESALHRCLSKDNVVLTAVSAPDIHLLRVFLAVTEAGGFSQAQIALNVSQSTISTQMADLETRLGLKLCRRGRAGFALTEDGKVVYDAAKTLFANCERFAETVNSRRGEITGELRIAIADALISNPDFRFDSMVGEIRHRLPAVRLNLMTLDPLEIERHVLDQKLHAGIHTFPNHAPGLRYIKLFKEKQTLYCGANHPLFGHEGELSIQDVEPYDYAARTYYGGMLRPGTFRPQHVVAYSSSMEGLVALVLSGKLLAHLPTHYAQPWVETDALKPLLPDELSYDSQFECIYPVGARISRALTVFEDVVKTLIATGALSAGN